MPPSSAQRLLDAQPPSTTPYTPSDTMARTYSRPTSSEAACRVMVRSPITSTSPNGMTRKVIRIGSRAMIGARVCNTRSAPGGIKSSLVISLIGSATRVLIRPRLNGSLPKMAARLAPIRSCNTALPLRSTHSSSPPRLMTMNRTSRVSTKEMMKSSMRVSGFLG